MPFISIKMFICIIILSFLSQKIVPSACFSACYRTTSHTQPHVVGGDIGHQLPSGRYRSLIIHAHKHTWRVRERQRFHSLKLNHNTPKMGLGAMCYLFRVFCGLSLEDSCRSQCSQLFTYTDQYPTPLEITVSFTLLLNSRESILYSFKCSNTFHSSTRSLHINHIDSFNANTCFTINRCTMRHSLDSVRTERQDVHIWA